MKAFCRINRCRMTYPIAVIAVILRFRRETIVQTFVSKDLNAKLSDFLHTFGCNRTHGLPVTVAYSRNGYNSPLVRSNTPRKGGRVVECTGLEIRHTCITYRGFESHPFRHLLKRPVFGPFPFAERSEQTAFLACGIRRVGHAGPTPARRGIPPFPPPFETARFWAVSVCGKEQANCFSRVWDSKGWPCRANPSPEGNPTLLATLQTAPTTCRSPGFRHQ
jgi:hypothetical protein